MYPEDIVQFVGKDNPLGKEIAKFPKAVQMKYLVVARVFSALMFEPSSGLLKEILDRLEGKVTEHVDMTTKGEQVSNLSDEQKILRVFELLKKVNDARP